MGNILYAQTSGNLLGDGISVQGGLGHLALRDDYISQEVYTGTLPYFEVVWLRSHDSSAYRFGLEYRNASNIRNNNVSTGVTQATLYLDFLYSTGQFSLLSKDVFTYAGPSTDIYVYFRDQNIAHGGSSAIFNVYSFAMFFSLGMNSTFVLPLQSKLSAEWLSRANILTFGMRLINMQDNNSDKEKMSKVTSIFSGIRGRSDLLLRYNVTDGLMLKAGYRFEICQSSSWDYLLSVSDNLVFILTYNL